MVLPCPPQCPLAISRPIPMYQCYRGALQVPVKLLLILYLPTLWPGGHGPCPAPYLWVSDSSPNPCWDSNNPLLFSPGYLALPARAAGGMVLL